MDRSRRPHSFSNTYSRMGSHRVGLSASHSAVIVLRRMALRYTHHPINEFYKKGCQEKTPPRPEWRFFLEIQPTVGSLLWRGLACCPFS